MTNVVRNRGNVVKTFVIVLNARCCTAAFSELMEAVLIIDEEVCYSDSTNNVRSVIKQVVTEARVT